MSLALYDSAFAKKLKFISEKSNIHVYNVLDTRRLFEVIADETNDKPIKLPIICLRRNDGYTLKEMGNNPRTANGIAIATTDGGSLVLNLIPILIQYLIDVYARKFEEADAIMRELVFILTNSPNIVVDVPYNGLEYSHISALHLSPIIRDNSSVAERLVTGLFSRLTLDCNIPDAHLFDIRTLQYVGLNILGYSVVSGDDPTPLNEAYHAGLNVVALDNKTIATEPLAIASGDADIIISD